ncbi:ADAM 17-like protease [Argopecten irradians]|uniref:ADAM 17-like protease n=1 Tax=Argopecten irradians TaxID=31199 RepID=UPI00371F27CD
MQRLTSLLWIIVLLCHYHLVWSSGITDKLRYYETIKASDIRVRVRRSADQHRGFDMKEIWLNTMGKDFHLALHQSPVLSSNFKATAINGDRKEVFAVDRSKFLSGRLYDDPDSSVHVHWDGEVMTASIATQDEVYFVEPSWRHLPPSVNHSMFTMYITAILETLSSFCQSLHVYNISLIDRVNGYYKSTVWTDNKEKIIRSGFEIVEIIVHESYSNSDNNNHYNMADRVNDMSNVLDWFGESHVQDFKDMCLGHLFTYQAFRGKLGLAYIASPHKYNLGGICSRAAYVNGKKQAVNTGVSSFQTPGGSTAMSLPSTLTVTHELGHNWGCEHDPDTSSCSPRSSSGGKFIMYPSSTTGYQANNQLFSPCSRQYVFKVLESKGYDCFSEKSPDDEATGGIGLCGNGRIDKDEECDAGKNGDLCCDTDCKLIGQATCRSSDPKGVNLGKRCCQSATSRIQRACTPLPLPSELSQLQDGSPCNYGFCKSGTCARTETVVKRLYQVLQYFSINRIEVILKDNVVWVILLLSSILWLIFIVIFECVDASNERKEKPTRENLTRMNNTTILPGSTGISEKIHFPIVRREFE